MIQLSPSKLSVLRDCPCCFWNANNRKAPRPRGIFPSLPGGIDLTLKEYFSNFRGDLPPVLKGQVQGVLMEDLATLKKWQNWRTGLVYQDPKLDVKIIGALDECLIDGYMYIPFDYKTKGSMPKTDGSEYYQLQMDLYVLMLEANGFATCEKAYIAYFWPNREGTREKKGEFLFQFDVKLFEFQCSINRAKETIAEAVRVLSGKRPDPSPGCEHCNFVSMYPQEEGEK